MAGSQGIKTCLGLMGNSAEPERGAWEEGTRERRL